MIMMFFMLLETIEKVVTKSLMVDAGLEYVIVEFEINRNKTALVSCVYRCPGSNIVSFNHNIEQLFRHLFGH